MTDRKSTSRLSCGHNPFTAAITPARQPHTRKKISDPQVLTIAQRPLALTLYGLRSFPGVSQFWGGVRPGYQDGAHLRAAGLAGCLADVRVATRMPVTRMVLQGCRNRICSLFHAVQHRKSHAYRRRPGRGGQAAAGPGQGRRRPPALPAPRAARSSRPDPARRTRPPHHTPINPCYPPTSKLRNTRQRKPGTNRSHPRGLAAPKANHALSRNSARWGPSRTSMASLRAG